MTAENKKDPAVKSTPELFSKMGAESRIRLAAAMKDVIAYDPEGTNWAVYWAKQFIRALDDTGWKPAALPLEPMICGCAQGTHEERRNTLGPGPYDAKLCKLGWPT